MIFLFFEFLIQAGLSSSTRHCELNNYENMIRQCGYCGSCKRDFNSTSGICDFNATTSQQLFINSSGKCLLRNYCKENEELCSKNDTNHFTGLCVPLYGSFICECQSEYFGTDCEHEMDSDSNFSSLAKINNVVYTPVLKSSESFEVYVSLLRRGLNLEIVVSNGQGEQQFFTSEKCKQSLDELVRYCTHLFDEEENVNLCKGDYNLADFDSSVSCLMIISVPSARKPLNQGELHDEFESNDGTVPLLMGKIGTFTVSVYNHLGSFNNYLTPVFSEEFTVTNLFDVKGHKSRCAPNVRLLNCGSNKNAVTKFSSHRNKLIIASYENVNENCEGTTVESVWMSWSLWHLKPSNSEFVKEPIKETHKSTVNLYREFLTLPYGTFQLKNTAKGIYRNDIVRESAHCYFQVINVPVETILLGGTLRLVDRKKDLHFRAIHFVDLDIDAINPSFKVVYTWRCDKNDYFCHEYKTTEPTRVVRGPFKVDDYTFTLTVMIKKPHYEMPEISTIHQTIITVKDSSNSNYGIICLFNCGSHVLRSNPDEVIHLELIHSEHLYYKSVLSSDFTGHWWYREESHENILNNVDAIRENGSDLTHWLNIKVSSLAENKTYIFFVTERNDSSSTKLAEIIINTCKRPTNTNCTITPDSGEKGRTFFDINCTNLFEDDQFTTMIYEFYNKHESNDKFGRHLGFSATGWLKRVLLTRNRLYVYAINFFGASSEYKIEVKLTEPKYQSRLLKLGNVLMDNYIYRIGLISANSDILSKNPVIRDETIGDLVENLYNEITNVVENTGAILLGNALYNTACKTHDSENITDISLERIAHTIHRVSLILLTPLVYRKETSRLITTQRLQNIIELITNCSCMILGNKGGYKSVDTDLQITLKSATLISVCTLDHLITAIAFMYLPAYKERLFNVSHLNLKVSRVTEAEVDDWTNQKGPYRISNSDVFKNTSGDLKTDFGFYFQTITYSINPFWWSNGDKINTNIMSRTFRKGIRRVDKFYKRHQFNLSVNNFNPAILSGRVSQPDPKVTPFINDFLVAVHRMDPLEYSTSFIEFLELNQTLRVSILQDQRPDYDDMVSKSTLVSKEYPKLNFSMLERYNFSCFYVGILPGTEVKVNESVSYTFKIISASCNVWIFQSWMSGNKCTVNKNTNEKNLFCDCNLASLTLGGSVYIPKNDFNLFSDVPLLIDVRDNVFIVAYVFVIVFIYLMVGLWTVNRDNHDEKRSQIIILGDNDPDDRFGYLVGVFTGSRVLAGTTANVCVQLVGDGGSSRRHILRTRKRATLQANGEDWFIIFTHRHLEYLKTIVIWTDFSGKNPNWYCSKIFVCDLTTFETDTFFVEKWLGYTMKGTRLYTRISCAISKEINRTSRLFFENTVYGFRELHLWASVLFRHPRSLRTRTQRLAIVLCELFSIMFVCSALYSLSSYQYEGTNPYDITENTVFNSFIASFSGTVISFIFAYAFRKSYEPVPVLSNIHEHSNYRSIYNIDRNLSDQQNKPSFLRYAQKCLYNSLHPCTMIPVVSSRRLTGIKINKFNNTVTWVLCISIVLVECHLVVILCWKRGNLSLSFWTSVGFAVCQTVFITLPLRIFLKAYLFASIRTHYCQLLYHNLDEEKISNKIELRRAEHIERCKDRARKAKYELPDAEQIRKVGNVRKKKLRVWVVVYTLSTVIFFAILCWHISNLSSSIQLFRIAVGCYEDQSCVKRYTTVEEALVQSLININKNVLPLLFQRLWYNNGNLTSKEEAFEETGWLKDCMSRLVGSPRLRQIRVKPECRKSSLAGAEKECTRALTTADEDHRMYSTGWERDGWTDSLFRQSPWNFTQPEDARGGVLISPSGYRCHGGGYIAYLKPTLKLSQIVIRDLINTRWVDQNTRVLIMEFTTFNPSSKTFTSTNIVDESLPTGLMLRSFTLQNIILSNIPLSGVCFFLHFFILLVTLIILINITGLLEFVKNLWNVNELIILIVYLITIFYNIQYIQKRSEYREKLSDEGKDVFFTVSEVVDHMEYTKNSIGILTALVSFRFLRIMRFNTNVRQYLHDLNNTRYDIYFIWITVVLFLYIQYRLIMYLIASPSINSLNDVLLLKADFRIVTGDINSTEGKIGAFLISVTSKFGVFSFIVSLAHYYKKILVKS